MSWLIPVGVVLFLFALGIWFAVLCSQPIDEDDKDDWDL